MPPIVRERKCEDRNWEEESGGGVGQGTHGHTREKGMSIGGIELGSVKYVCVSQRDTQGVWI